MNGRIALSVSAGLPKLGFFDEKCEVEQPILAVFEMVTMQLGRKAGIYFGVLR